MEAGAGAPKADVLVRVPRGGRRPVIDGPRATREVGAPFAVLAVVGSPDAVEVPPAPLEVVRGRASRTQERAV